jgi:hypothetical protein
VYPARFRLPLVTEHVLALLERRRPGFGEWGPEVEAHLEAEARQALGDVGRQFSEVAVDPGYWERLERSVSQVALPRYFQLAREHHALQRRKYGLWRGGDLVSRAVYTAVGILLAIVIAVTPIPNWMEPLPIALILFGPFLPDMQEWSAERRYRGKLGTLVQEMEGEQQQLEAYRSLEDIPAPIAPVSEAQPPQPSRNGSKEKS